MTLSDQLSILALALSIISLLSSLYTIYLSKRIEILYSKFSKLCLENVDRIYDTLDDVFSERGDESMDHFKSTVTDTIVELQLFLIVLKNTYPKIDLKKIDLISSDFSDVIYMANPGLKVRTFKSNYYSSKLSTLNILYEFAIRREISFFENLGVNFNWRFWKRRN